ncbi:stage II sporulation protein P [Paenibacillus sp. J2TS4]|uniref:stage II sporulation protein P n=1 Tax=Paenibacillus sp. J2TS4 TaxID=2807194 RepID=UPI001B271BA3|nr:stage II sporulation protein P [Paenibacillus sp. J2TS4]GIP31802.1 hypothetical protein J2TS4_10120 [Paenibacillus sp. J2TS4]
MLDYKKIGVAVSSLLLVGILNGADVHAQEASGEQAILVQVETNNVQANLELEKVEEKFARSTVDRLNVRTEPSLTSSVLLMIGKSNRYGILDEQEEWVKIRLHDEREGWVFREYIDYEQSEPAKVEAEQPEAKRPDEVEAEQPEAKQPDEVEIASLNQATVVNIVDITNMRSGPGTDYDIVGKAQPGETYPIVDTEGEWHVIMLPDESKAYVASWVVKTDFLSRNANVISSVNKENVEFAPKLYIYHTHNRESWNNIARNTKGTSVDDPEVNITLVGKRLGQLLKEKEIPALLGNDDFSEKLKQQKLSFSHSYKVSRQAVDKAKETYPSLSYFFDIHRDANIPREKTTVTIEGKAYARILFVIGTAHSGYEENQAFAEAMDKLLDEKYPGLSRGVLTKSAHQGDGEYNQSVSPGSLLMEIGGTNNTLQESLHTAEAIADVFAEYYRSVK